MLDRLIDHALRHALFLAGQRIGVAVSGGADSVFLLHALHELAPRWNLGLSVIHIEHGIRGAASRQDADFVQALAAGYALPFHLHEANVLATDGNLEQEARRTRHAFFHKLIHDREIDRVATGHTRSDQAETVLYRILRGSGLTGLAGVLPITTEGLVRPLLPLTRQQVRGWLSERGYAWREDATNQDLSLQRNKIRQEILPNLETQFNPNIEDALANLAILAQDEEAYWHQMFPKLPPAGPVVILNTADVSRQPAVGRRLLRQAISQVKGDLRQIEFGHIERLLRMAAQLEEGHDRAILPGIDAIRSFHLLRIAPLGYDKSRIRDYSFSLDSAELQTGEFAAGPVTLGLVRIADMVNDVQPCATLKEKIDWQRLISLQTTEGKPLGLELRNWRPGDQYCRIGAGRSDPDSSDKRRSEENCFEKGCSEKAGSEKAGSGKAGSGKAGSGKAGSGSDHSGKGRPEKIKQMFQEFRIPLWERHEWPVLTAQGTIVWARQFGPAAEFGADASSQLVLSIRETNESG